MTERGPHNCSYTGPSEERDPAHPTASAALARPRIDVPGLDQQPNLETGVAEYVNTLTNGH